MSGGPKAGTVCREAAGEVLEMHDTPAEAEALEQAELSEKDTPIMRRTSICFVVLGLLALPATGFAQVTPDDFESGDLSNWQVLGVAGVSSGLYNGELLPGEEDPVYFVPGTLAIPPFAGSFMGIVADGTDYYDPFPEFGSAYPDASGTPASAADLEAFLGEAPGYLDSKAPGETGFFFGDPAAFGGSAMVRSFPVNAGDTIVLQWNLQGAESGINWADWVLVDIQLDDGTGNKVELLSSDLRNWPGSTRDGVLFPRLNGSFSKHTGWQPLAVEATSGGIATVRTAVVDNGSRDVDTGVIFTGINEAALLLDGDGVVPGGDGAANTAPTCEVDTTLSDHMLIDGQWVVTEGDTLQICFVGFDSDGDPLTATVDQAPAGAQIANLSGAQPLVVLAQWTPTAADDTGSQDFQVTFTDPAGGTSTCTFTVDDVNQLPVCDAAGDVNGQQVVECTGGGASLTLAGSATDPDDTSLSFHWDVSDASVVLDDPDSATATGTFSMGMHMATLTVADGRGGVSVCDVEVVVQDTVPPEVTCTTDVAALWPPKHDMIPVQVYVEISDLCDDPSSVLLDTVHVRSDEPDDSTGDGRTIGDVDGLDGFSTPADVTPQLVYDAALNAFTGTVQLRAERDGSGNGRAYTIDVTGTDSSGNSATTSCVVVVPHDKRGSK